MLVIFISLKTNMESSIRMKNTCQVYNNLTKNIKNEKHLKINNTFFDKK